MLSAEYLAERVLLDQLAQLADQGMVASAVEFQLDALLKNAQMILVEPGSRCLHQPALDVRGGRPAPQGERGSQLTHRVLIPLLGSGGPAEPGQALEVRDVQCTVCDIDAVAS